MYETVDISKLETDIKDSYSESKTGIHKDKIKKIICFHTNTKIKPGNHTRLTTLYKDTTIEYVVVNDVRPKVVKNIN